MYCLVLFEIIYAFSFHHFSMMYSSTFNNVAQLRADSLNFIFGLIFFFSFLLASVLSESFINIKRHFLVAMVLVKVTYLK